MYEVNALAIVINFSEEGLLRDRAWEEYERLKALEEIIREAIKWFISKPKYQDPKKLARTIARILVGIRLIVFNNNSIPYLDELVQDELDRIQRKLQKKPRSRRSRR